MILNFKLLNKIFVVRADAKKIEPLAKVVDAVINPDNFKFEAYWVLTPDGMRLLLPESIVKFQKELIHVKDENVFLTPESAVRLKKVLNREISVLKAKVYCNKVLIGTVSDFTFDTLSPRILQLTVQGGFLGFRKSLIHVSRVYKTDKHGIHVFDNTVLKSLKKSESENKRASVDAVNCEK